MVRGSLEGFVKFQFIVFVVSCVLYELICRLSIVSSVNCFVWRALFICVS